MAVVLSTSTSYNEKNKGISINYDTRITQKSQILIEPLNENILDERKK